MNDFEIFQTLLGNLDCHESRINFITKIINTIPDPVFVKDREHRWLVLNDALCEFIGMPREALIGKTDYDFFPKEEADIFWQKDDEVFRTGQENINEESITDSNGVAHIFSTRKAIFQEQTTGQQFLVGTIRDFTELRKTEEKLKAAVDELQKISNTDPLTGLSNRRHMLAVAEQEIKIAQRQHRAVLLLFIDINGLKIINDKYGHIEGDIAIRQVANLLKDNFRDSDVIARIGGDEFVVLAFDVKHEQIEQATHRFYEAIDHFNATSDAEHTLSVSVGSSCSEPGDDISIYTLLDRADNAMYRVKAQFKKHEV
ncbi:MAG: diguanylate cyclase [Neptuniibacter sp.]